MLGSKPYTGATKLILAFDIGTTFSGVSYCILEPGKIPEIFGVTRFPAQELVRADAKVPSLLYYDKNGVVQAAGAEVLAESIIERALAGGWTRAEWWKLHLRPNHLASSINPQDDLPPLPTGKSAVDILTDFIKYLFNCAKTYIHGRPSKFSWSTLEDSVELIVTHPNGWGGVQQMYRQAVARTCLIPSSPEGQSRVHLLTEGEACLHFCVSNLLNTKATDKSTPQGVVIIDAGHRTIDLSMFLVKSNPISCEEIAPAECRLQGSDFVTRRARALLQQKLQGWEHSSPDEINEFTREFDTSTRLVIKSDKEPGYIRVAGRRYHNQKYNIAFGKLKLSGQEATGLFNDSIDAIINAFEQQEKHANTQITTAFLVGDLSTNDWLWSRLQSYFKSRSINICRPDNHINKAVANGAVLSHVDCDHHLAASRVAPGISPGIYGIVCASMVDNEDEHCIGRKGTWEVDPTGDCFVSGYFEPKFRRDAHVREEIEFREAYALAKRDPKGFGMQTVRLVHYRGKLSNPEWVDQDESSFSTFCTIYVDLSKTVEDLSQKKIGGQVYYKLDYEVIVIFGLREVRAYLCWKSEGGEKRWAFLALTIEWTSHLAFSDLWLRIPATIGYPE